MVSADSGFPPSIGNGETTADQDMEGKGTPRAGGKPDPRWASGAVSCAGSADREGVKGASRLQKGPHLHPGGEHTWAKVHSTADLKSLSFL